MSSSKIDTARQSSFKRIFNLEKKTISRLSLDFRDKDLNQKYIDTYFPNYIKIVRLVIGILIFITFIYDALFFFTDESLITFQIIFFNLVIGLSFYFVTFIPKVKNHFSKIVFIFHISVGFYSILLGNHYEFTNLVTLQILISFTIFPRNYFKFSIFANIIVFIALFLFGDRFQNINAERSVEILLLFLTIVYIEFSNYLKEATYKNDFLNSIKIMEQEEKTNLLLENTLPKPIAIELKENGFVEPKEFSEATILFTDFKNFTKITEDLSPVELLKELDAYFFQFDEICKRYNLEKLKTIGDSYMAVAGVPIQNWTHAIDACLVSLEMQKLMFQIKEFKTEVNMPFWELRIGIHSGEVIGGVIGKTKFAYDVWGDAVNLASRMESSGESGRINISEQTYEKIKDFFECEYRGEIEAKNKGKIKMYFLNSIKPELSVDAKGFVPNDKFNLMYGNI